jgi:hypothetical protein
VDNLAVHTAVGNRVAAAHIELDIAAVVAHMVETDIVVVAVHIAMDIVAPHMIATDTVAVVAHIVTECMVATDIVTEAEYTVATGIVDTVLTVVYIVAGDWYTDLSLLEHTTVGRMDLCPLMCCRSHRKTAHSPHFVFRNLCSTLSQSVQRQEHAHHDHTGYKMSYWLEPGYGMPDTQL